MYAVLERTAVANRSRNELYIAAQAGRAFLRVRSELRIEAAQVGLEARGHKDAGTRPAITRHEFMGGSSNRPRDHSWRMAVRGSALEAERAGKKHATIPIAKTVAITTAKVHGSVGLTFQS